MLFFNSLQTKQHIQTPAVFICRISLINIHAEIHFGTTLGNIPKRLKSASCRCHLPLAVLRRIIMTITRSEFIIFYTCTILMPFGKMFGSEWKTNERKVTLRFKEHSAIIYFHNLKNHHISHLENSDSVANNTVFEKCKVTIQILNRKRIN